MNYILLIIFILFILERLFYYLMDYLNVGHMRQNNSVPKEFEGIIDEQALQKSQAYTVVNTQFGIFSGLFSDLLTGAFIFLGLLNIYNDWILSLSLPFIAAGIVFVLAMVYAETILTIPFDLYHTFKIENKFGFNTMTKKLWIMDFIKSLVLQTVLVSALLAGALLIVQASPKLWWLWLWFFYFIFSLFMMYISPYVIEPLFNKFAPVDDAELSEKITQLLAKTGIKVSRVFKMDASKRSRHSNAYFTGIGRVKRIVLFDTLLNDMNHDEILSVLAHEAGHWKKKHILKSIIVSEVVSIAVFFIASYIFSTDWLVKIFNLSHDSFLAKMVLLGFIGGLAGFFISPLSAYFSRRNERQADDYAKELMGTSEGLKSALKKLSKDNLSNLYPHPLFVLFHYSHPPILSRLARM